MCEAAEQSKNIRGQLEGILTVLFDYFLKNRELMRISFATMFAAPGEVPAGLRYADKCERNLSSSIRSSSARRKTGSWTNVSTAGSWRSVFTGR